VLYRKPEFEGEAIIPCIISSIVAFTTFITLRGDASKVIPIERGLLDQLVLHDPRELLLYLLLALLCSLVSLLYVRTFEGVHGGFKRLSRVPAWVRPGIGGLLTALVALAIVPFAGSEGVLFGGYGLMASAIAGTVSVGVMALLVLGKILSTSFSIATGGSGGVFAPSLAIGALLGAIVGQAAAQWFPSLGVVPAAFTLVGMAGFFSGVAKTPIAAILIVCEMTGGYGLLAPLMLVSVVHLLLAKRWTIYNTQVDGLVDSPAHAGDFVVDVLERMKVSDLLIDAPEPQLVSENTTLRRALEIVSTANGYYFPVVDREEALVGIFSLSDVRRIFQQLEVADLVIVRDFMVENVVTTHPEETLNQALQRLNEHGLHELPIVDQANPRRVVGMLSRNRLGAAYHRRLHALKRAGADADRPDRLLRPTRPSRSRDTAATELEHRVCRPERPPRTKRASGSSRTAPRSAPAPRGPTLRHRGLRHPRQRPVTATPDRSPLRAPPTPRLRQPAPTERRSIPCTTPQWSSRCVTRSRGSASRSS